MTSTENTRDQIIALNQRQTRFYIIFGSICAFLLLALMLAWTPVMKPWTQERLGTANLRKAEFDNKIQAEQSAAERDAAILRAEAITIVGAVAQEFPEYRSQEFIGGFAQALMAGKVRQTFYIPTQNSIPVLPAMANTGPVTSLDAENISVGE